MRQLIDGIIYIDSLSGLITHFLENRPECVTEVNGTHVITGFDQTPIFQNGDKALVYIRMEPDQAVAWVGTPNVTILAQRPYADGVQDALYADLFADSEALALYDSVYDRMPHVEDGETITPPDRFGQMW